MHVIPFFKPRITAGLCGILFCLWHLSVFAAITVTAGNGQTIPVGKSSENISFKVVDAVGNPSTGVTVNFRLTSPTGTTISDGLSLNAAVTDTLGQVSTQLKPVKTIGSYSITANLANDVSQLATATVTVIAASPAALTVTAGDNQSVPAGQSSEAIKFKVSDANGNGISGQTINFSLKTPTGETVTSGLSNTTAVSDANGEVLTRLNAMQKLGNYTVVATLATDATKTSGAVVVVVASQASLLTVVSGANQTVAVGENSAVIKFKLSDASGNGISGQNLVFTLTTPSGGSNNNGITPAAAKTDANGEASTRLNVVDVVGNYTITAAVQDNKQITTTVTVIVAEPMPNLPSLGFGGSVNALGNPLDTTATFNGGISVNGGEFQRQATLKLKDSVVVQGAIKVDSRHVGQIANLVVVSGYSPLPPDNTFSLYYMLNSLGQIQAWNVQISTLVPFRHGVTLSPVQTLHIYTGRFIATGILWVYFGYQLPDGTVVFNADQRINIQIDP